MRALLLTSLLCLLALASCTKDPTTGTTTVEGQVVDDYSRKPVSGGLVQLYHKDSGKGYQAVGNRIPADAQGRFSFSFEATSTTGYFLTAIAAPGYFTPEQNAPYLTAGRANKDITIAMLAPAWVRFQLVDEPPKSQIVITTNGYEGAGHTFYYPHDTVVTRPLIPNFKYAISWWINDQGHTSTTSIYVQANPLDTVTVRIPF